MKTNQTKRIEWRKWLATAWSRFADACAFSVVTQGGWVPPEPVMREIVERTTGRSATTRAQQVQAGAGEAAAVGLGCCVCCAG